MTKLEEFLGFGFNIIGGIDKITAPGLEGILVSLVKEIGPAKRSGLINVGDRILKVIKPMIILF